MTPLVMIPGMMCDERIFAPQIEELISKVSVHIADISRHDTISELAADVLSYAPPKFCLAGHSMGGIVAMEICAQAPKRIEKLALIDTKSNVWEAVGEENLYAFVDESAGFILTDNSGYILALVDKTGSSKTIVQGITKLQKETLEKAFEKDNIQKFEGKVILPV